MFRCPFCLCASITRSSQYVTNQTKESYYQCKNLECSATFKAFETIASIIKSPRADNQDGDYQANIERLVDNRVGVIKS